MQEQPIVRKERFRFSVKGIMCDAYVPSRTFEARAAGIMLYGYPATIGENSASDTLVRHGLASLQPHYPGTYDSDGLFTPHSAIEMVGVLRRELASGAVCDLKSQKRAMLPKTLSVCIGYSFGAIIAMNALQHLDELKVLILLAPVITYNGPGLHCGYEEEGMPFLDYLKRTRPHTYRLGDLGSWEALYNGRLNQPRGVTPSKLTHVIGIVGSNDKGFDLSTMKQNFEPIVRGAVGRRPEVTLLIVNGGHSVNELLIDDGARVVDAVLKAL